jgi:methionyl aminopeptidase
MELMNILIKSEKQIAGIRASSKLAAQTLEFIKPHIQPGVRTIELDCLIEKFIKDHGATSATLGYKGFNSKYPSFPRSSCISLNEVVCHGIADNTILKDGDLVGIDVTTILNGYYGDTAYTFAVGEVSEDAKHLLDVTKKCLELGIKQVKPGAMTGMIGHAVYSYAILQGCTVVEAFCGHGVGLHFHEPPQIFHAAQKTDGVVMFDGMTFTIEPMINLGTPDVVIDEKDGWTVRTADNQLSAQFEHTVLVTKMGFEILTLP